MWVMESQECVTPESKVCKDCGTEKPITEFYRKGSTGRFFTSCKECCKARDKANYLKNREAKLAKCAIRRSEKKAEIAEYMVGYYLRNRDSVLARSAEYRKRPEVMERERERQKMYYAARSAEIQAKRLAAMTPERRDRFNRYLKQHYEANKPTYIAKGGKRRAVKLRATAAWADLDAIRRIYLMAEKISRETGIRHHVDHVIPLRGKTVSGLHVENNLQIIPATQNRRKANRLLEG